MELTIDKSLLQDVFNRVAKVVEQKTVSPIAGTVKMEVSANKLRFIGRGSEMFVLVDVDESDFKVEKLDGDEFSVCIPADVFSQLLPKLPNYLSGVIRLSVTNDNGDFEIVILAPKAEKEKSSSRYKLDALDGEEFFDLPDVDFDNEIAMKNSDLLGIVSKVPVASGKEHYRLFYMATQFQIKDNELLVAATDGSRLAELVVDADKIEDTSFMCFARSLEHLKTIFDFGEDTDDIKIAPGDSHIRFSQGDRTTYIGRVITDFPKYREQMPSDFYAEVKVEKNSLVEYLEPALLLSDVKVILSFTEDGIEIKGEDSSTSSLDTIDIVKWVDGEEVDNLIFSGEYLLEQLKVFDDQTIAVKIIGQQDQKLLQLCGERYMQLLSSLQDRSANNDDSDE